jgi:hypothetical protein
MHTIVHISILIPHSPSPALPILISSRTRTSRIFPPTYCKKFYSSLKCRGPLALTENYRVDVGLTSIPKTNTNIKKDRQTFNHQIFTIEFFFIQNLQNENFCDKLEEISWWLGFEVPEGVK